MESQTSGIRQLAVGFHLTRGLKVEELPKAFSVGGNALLLLVLQNCRIGPSKGRIIFIITHLWKFLDKTVQQLFIRIGHVALLPTSLCCMMQSSQVMLQVKLCASSSSKTGCMPEPLDHAQYDFVPDSNERTRIQPAD